jgi:hypothetical protein
MLMRPTFMLSLSALIAALSSGCDRDKQSSSAMQAAPEAESQPVNQAPKDPAPPAQPPSKKKKKPPIYDGVKGESGDTKHPPDIHIE